MEVLALIAALIFAAISLWKLAQFARGG